VLLHLWSLGIEEQFYVVWPALLMLVWRFRHGVVVAIVATIVVSFAANICLTGRAPAGAFYSPVSRAWELMVGCALAWLVARGWKLRGAPAQVASAAGFALLAAGFLLLDQASAFPGWWALLPTLGAFLVISAGPETLLNRLILANRAAVAMGLISYPLYLWHWPLLALVRIVEAGTPSAAIRIAAVAVAFVAATTTYLLVERPIRNARQGRTRTALGLLGGGVLVGAVGFLCYSMNGFPGMRFLDPQREAFVRHFDDARPDWHYLRTTGLLEKFRDECNFYDTEAFLAGHATQVPKKIDGSCTERDPAKRYSVMLWGDSHAQHLYWGLARNLPRDWQILQVASSACTPEVDAAGPSTTNYCQQSNWTALQTIARDKPDVVIPGPWRGPPGPSLRRDRCGAEEAGR
jgi:Predicted acyltransferases